MFSAIALLSGDLDPRRSRMPLSSGITIRGIHGIGKDEISSLDTLRLGKQSHGGSVCSRRESASASNSILKQRID